MIFGVPILLSAIRNLQSAIGGPQSEIAGSPAWQIAFFCVASCLILFEVIRGWRLGVMRQLMRALAVALAYAAGYFGGDWLVPFLRSYLRMPDMVISVLGGAILAVAVYGVVSSLGTILFKRTSKQATPGARLAYGISGALIGLCFGGFFIWLILVGIRTVGSIAEAQVRARPQTDAAEKLKRNSGQEPDESISANVNADSVTTMLARLKNSVELGPVGNVIRETDVIPTGGYQTLGEAGIVLANPESAQRFFNFPGVKELSENPKIVALRNDPEINEMIRQGRVLDLLREPRVVDAINDPALSKQVKAFDLKQAIEYAKQR